MKNKGQTLLGTAIIFFIVLLIVYFWAGSVFNDYRVGFIFGFIAALAVIGALKILWHRSD